MNRVLLVDDDAELCQLLSRWLEQEGFAISVCHTAAEARTRLAGHPPADAVVLDVMLPDGSGLELLRRLRTEYPELPLLMLSGRGEPLDRILGLELGADDYLAKPCDPRELSARLRAILRRSLPPAVAQLHQGDLDYSPARGVVQIGEHQTLLTLCEGRLLEALLQQPGEPVDKQTLALQALGRKLSLYDRSLDMHVSNLRGKLGPHADGRPRIVALRGRGYYYAP